MSIQKNTVKTYGEDWAAGASRITNKILVVHGRTHHDQFLSPRIENLIKRLQVERISGSKEDVH